MEKQGHSRTKVVDIFRAITRFWKALCIFGAPIYAESEAYLLTRVGITLAYSRYEPYYQFGFQIFESISILSEPGGAAEGTRNIPGSWGQAGEADDFSAPRWQHVSEDEREQPEWLARELLKQSRRRHSDTLGEKPKLIRPQQHSICSTHSLEEFDTHGLRGIDERIFEQIMKKCLGLPNMSNKQIHELFKKIDHLGHGGISWGDFCTHVLQQYNEKEEAVRRRKQVAFRLPATMSACGRGIPVVNIHSFHDGTMLTVCEDGFVCHWSPELKPQRTKHLFREGHANRRSKWVSDFALMLEYNNLIIGTGDREIQFYDLSTLQLRYRISALDTIPLTLDYSDTGPDKCCILYGDTEIDNIPNVTIDKAVLSPNVTLVRWKVHSDWVTQAEPGLVLVLGLKRPEMLCLEKILEKLSRIFSKHNIPVSWKAKYVHSLRAVVSSSSEESSSIVIGCALPSIDFAKQLKEIREASYDGKTRKKRLSWTPQARESCDHTVFTVYKGVKTFDICHSLLATGGMDRQIRLWNPHFSGKPTGILKGHTAPIIYLCISSEHGHIFSVSTDGAVKIWHIEDQCCLYTADPKASGLYGDIFACRYSPALKSLYIAAGCMAVLTLNLRPRLHRHLTESHNEPVTCCCYSEVFRQVVSCSEGSVVKIWDFDTGRQSFEFGGRQDLTGITCMTLDSNGRRTTCWYDLCFRLITGGRDGSLKIWNFNNGQCLKTLKKDSKCHVVCDCIFLKVDRNFFIMSVGGDRKIDIYADIPEDLHHVQGPQPSWEDDLINGHKSDILCVVQYPPSLLATSSKDGEIIAWDLVSGHILCRIAALHTNAEGLDTSVPSIIFLQNSKLQQFSSTTVLLSSGVRGCVDLWNVLGGGGLLSTFKASKCNQKITKLAKTGKDTLLYAADRIGYIHVYNMEKFDPEIKSPRAETSWWRPHQHNYRKTPQPISTNISFFWSSLQIVDSDQVVLTSSTDHTVRSWSAQGEYIGTFGQPEIWNVHVSSSWMHPHIPFEVLTDPLSMPDLDFLNGKPHRSESINPEADRGELKCQKAHVLRALSHTRSGLGTQPGCCRAAHTSDTKWQDVCFSSPSYSFKPAPAGMGERQGTPRTGRWCITGPKTQMRQTALHQIE
ncbi:cilia- and flagella-associated protein 337 [Xenentodon cancila]